MRRTGQQRLDAIPAAVERRDEFLVRVAGAEGDAVRCADLMAEAITMKTDANFLEVVERSGKVMVTIESVMAAHCMIDARDAFLKAKAQS
jgi:hypothetical protein